MSAWTPEMKAAGERVRARIYQLVIDNSGISSHTIAGLFDMPVRTIAGHLSVLAREGKVMVKRGAPATGGRAAYPTAPPAPRAVNRGGKGKEIPMPDDAEHRAWMAYWKARRVMRQAGAMAMRGRV